MKTLKKYGMLLALLLAIGPAATAQKVWVTPGTTVIRLSKGVENLSLTKKFTFNIEEKYSDVSYSIFGTVKEGTMVMKLYTPDKKTFKEFKITPGQEQSRQESFTPEEFDEKPFSGKWIIELSCTNATGYYMLMVRGR